MISISEDGKIFDENGRVYEYLQKYGKRGQKYFVSKYGASHRLIASALVPNPKNKSEVDHINGDATDNRPENLRWVSQEENKALHNCNTIFYIINGKISYVTFNLSKFCEFFNLDKGALRKTSPDTKANDRRYQHKGYSILKKDILEIKDRNLEQILLPFVEKK